MSAFRLVLLMMLVSTGGDALAARCRDGRFLVTGASPLGIAGADSEVIDIVGGEVTMGGGCPPAPAVLNDPTVNSDFTVAWAMCGSSSNVVLRASIRGRDCDRLRASLRATRGGKRRTRQVRALRVEPVFPTIIPEPAAAWQPIDSGPFVVTPHTKVLVERRRPDVAAVAEQLVALLQRQGLTSGTVGTLLENRQPPNSVLLTTEDAGPLLGAEGYVLRVSPSRIVLRAPTVAGLFYAVQTLRHLLPVELDGPPTSSTTWAVPAIAVDDQPRFRWRGFMLDVSRTFAPIESLRRWVDLLALHKLNVFHLHLTDDQGWRIESDAFPALHLKGSNFDPVLAPNEVGGYYTRADLVGLVAYAAARNVEIVPEIEMPWHGVAMLHALPALACETSPGVPRLASEFPIVPWGVIVSPPPTLSAPVLCVCDPAIWTTIATLLDEITAIFPSRFIHLGGDEVPSAAWLDTYLCPGLIASEGLDGVDDLHAWFSKRLEDMLRARGRVLVGWDEVLEDERPFRPTTTLSASFTTMHWRRRYSPATLFDRDVIQAMDNPYYLSLEIPSYNTYAFEPVPAGATSSQAAHVLGVEAAMWTHEDRTPADIDRRVFPRLGALAEVGWTPPERKDWTNFEARWARNVGRLDFLGVAR